jgi:hypothetical protein
VNLLADSIAQAALQADSVNQVSGDVIDEKIDVGVGAIFPHRRGAEENSETNAGLRAEGVSQTAQ